MCYSEHQFWAHHTINSKGLGRRLVREKHHLLDLPLPSNSGIFHFASEFQAILELNGVSDRTPNNMKELKTTSKRRHWRWIWTASSAVHVMESPHQAIEDELMAYPIVGPKIVSYFDEYPRWKWNIHVGQQRPCGLVPTSVGSKGPCTTNCIPNRPVNRLAAPLQPEKNPENVKGANKSPSSKFHTDMKIRPGKSQLALQHRPPQNSKNRTCHAASLKKRLSRKIYRNSRTKNVTILFLTVYWIGGELKSSVSTD